MATKIYMDSDMLESYSSYEAAADAFSRNIALENIHLDTTLQIEFGISNEEDLFSSYALEAIGETVKNMASKAKSNFITYAKKLINFLFGWLINFFKGATNVKKAMAKSYEKARTYLKKLNELESKARGANKEDKIEITDFGNCVVVGLAMIQAIIVSTKHLGEHLKNAYSESRGTSNNGDGKNSNTTRAFKILQVLLERLQNLYAVVSSINISDVKELLSKLKASQYNVETYMNSLTKDAKKLVKEAKSDVNAENTADDNVFQKAGKAIKSGANKVYETTTGKVSNSRQESQTKTSGQVTNKLEGTYKSRLEATAKYMSEPNKAEMGLTEAFDELRLKLNTFVEFSKANKWDLEKNIASVEKLRRGLEKEISNIDVTNVNEKVVSELLQRIISVGNNLGQIQRSAGVVAKRVSACIDGMTTDVAKLGSKLIKIGDTE